MEDVAEALKIALAVIMFVLAVSITFIMFTQANTVSEVVFFMGDKTNFYSYVSDDGSKNGRVVGVETIIPTLYRYYKENFIVFIKDQNGNIIKGKGAEEIGRFDSDYEAKVFSGYFDENNVYHKPEPGKAPWVGNANVDTKKRIDLFVSGQKGKINYYYDVDYTGYGLLEKYGNKKFVETVREYSKSGITEETEDGEEIEVVKGDTKLEITYTML